MSEFLQMGGYAQFVWGSYAAGVAVFVWNCVAPVLKRRSLLRALEEEREES